ncbi:MAG: DHH family phosphoesterase [Oscillospiraceae bacterium]|nr:DHH family phosphoesterase [Oscillospiraceae bacterium]
MKNFYRDGGLVLSIVALTVVTVAVSAILYVRDLQLFLIFAPFVVLTTGFTTGKLIQVTRKTFQYLGIIKNEINLADSDSLYNFPVAIGIIDKERRLVWFNAGFIREFKPIAVFGTSLATITTASTELLLSGEGARVKYGGKYYKVNAVTPSSRKIAEETVGETAGEVFIVYFEDITKEVILEIEKKLSQPVVLLIMIDSYEEIFSGGSESTIASVTVQIDKLLEDYVKTTTGIIRKTGQNRFWVVIEERHARELIEGKVQILDKARKIAATDRISVTLSVGIGKTGKDLAQSEEFARQALEMALGRGGDQAAVKTKSGFEFYGGFSKGVERHTKVRARIIAGSLMDLADTSDIIYIMGHKFSDLDSIGSAAGLACGLRNLGKSAYVVIDKSTSLGANLIEKVEEHEAAGKNPVGLFIPPGKALDAWTDNSLLIIVDTHNKKLLESLELYESAQKVVVIDHHRKMVDFIENAKIFHHEVTASSASEMVTELLQHFSRSGSHSGPIISGEQAEALLAGIMLDTKNFSLKTGVRTFEAAAFLRKLGADTVSVKSLFSNTIENYKQKVNLVRDAAVYRECAIACSETVGGDIRIVAPQAADELLEIAGVSASFLIYKTANNEISLSARSLGNINVQVIMESLGGGGHHNMAGAQLSDVSIAVAEKRLKSAIDEYFNSLTS